ncbi:hypothetical protein T08_9661 [Trichinella sp. T8]|nr:hypothetical protein T08_9661 [Trichinella sp. T8]
MLPVPPVAQTKVKTVMHNFWHSFFFFSKWLIKV